MKPYDARVLEARSRSKEQQVRIGVVSHCRLYVTISPTTTGEPYTLERTRKGWTCTCAGYHWTGCCKHLGSLQRRAEREGWNFGVVAPRVPEVPTQGGRDATRG